MEYIGLLLTGFLAIAIILSLFAIVVSQDSTIRQLRQQLGNAIVVSKQLEDEVLEARDRLTEGNS